MFWNMVLPGHLYTACRGLVALRFDAIGRLCSGIWSFLDICILSVMVWSLFVLMPLIGYVLEYGLPGHLYTVCHGLVALRFDAIGRLCSGIWSSWTSVYCLSWFGRSSF